MSTLTADQLSKLTPEQRKQIADHMVVPLRCGGCHYDEQGRRLHMHGGKWLLEDGPEYRELLRRHGHA